APAYFDSNSFIDPKYPPGVSQLDVRKKILRTFITGAVCGLGNMPDEVHEGEKLERALFGSGSRFFNSNFTYYALYQDPATRAYAWAPTSLTPKLTITGY